MANEQNLIPVTKRTKSEAREISHNGGVASGKKRREQRDFRELYKIVCSSRLPRYKKDIVEELELAGIKSKDQSRKLAIVLAQVRLAESGGQASTKAAEHIAKMMGEYPADKTELTGANGSPLIPDDHYDLSGFTRDELREMTRDYYANKR